MHAYNEQLYVFIAQYFEVTMVLNEMREDFSQLRYLLCDKLCFINDTTDTLLCIVG